MDKDDIAKEFDDFVYIVSHDMAAPQRHIREFTKLLLSSFNTPLNDEQNMYRDFIEKGLARLEKMQAALLEYSRVTTHGNPFTEFDSGACLQDVLQKMAPRIAERQAVIDLPEKTFSLSADREQIGRVFDILIDNAMTYAVPDCPPHIVITADKDGSDIRFIIRDNGIGIHPDHADMVFGMFRRLHGADAYGGGAGAGLAIARKIVRRHGGHIALTPSQDNTGAIFTILLKGI